MNTPNKQAELEKEIEKLKREVEKKIGCNPTKDKKCIADGNGDHAYWNGDIDILKAELKGIKETKAQALADEIEFLKKVYSSDNLRAYRLMAERLVKLQSQQTNPPIQIGRARTSQSEVICSGSIPEVKTADNIPIKDVMNKYGKIIEYGIHRQEGLLENNPILSDFKPEEVLELRKSFEELKAKLQEITG